MVAAAALLVAFLAGCGTAGAPGPAAADVPGARVSVPVGWAFSATDPAEWGGRPTIALLSNRPIEPVCDGDGAARRCSSPASELRPGQLLVWWLSTTCAGPACTLPDGERRLVGGREAVEVTDVSTCDGMGADRQRAVLVAVSPQRTDALVVCGRAIDAGAQAQLDALLDGIDWRTP
jgi:hypothetical protein